jgi:predicted dehydrogenase
VKRKLRVGIIGCGRIAGLLQDDPLRKGIVTHVAAYKALPERFEIVACASQDDESARNFSAKFAIPRWYNDHRTLLQTERLDIVSICAYTDSRYRMIKDAIAAGVRGIFCEKPIAASLQEVDQIISLCKRYHVRLSVNHTRRWGHDYRTVKYLLDSGRLGKVKSAVGYFSGALFHTGTHMFDIMNFFFGKPIAVMGTLTHARGTGFHQIKATKGRFDDHDGLGFIFYPKNVTAAIIGVPKKYFLFELDIQTDTTRIRIGNHLLEMYSTDKSVHYTGFNELRPSTFSVEPYALPPLVWAVDDLACAVQSRKKLISSADDARAALEIAFALLASHKQKGRTVLLPLKIRKKKVLAR